MVAPIQSKHNTESLENLTFGFLVWWTIKQGVYDLQRLQEFGTEAGLPQVMKDLITGAPAKSAWLKATNLGAKGWDSKSSTPRTTARYMTRDVGKQVRAVIRETIDENHKAVATEQIGLIGLDEEDIAITATVTDTPKWEQRDLLREIVNLIEHMQLELESRTGQIDDAKVRAAILKWLNAKHRVCVRNTGGVYYIPLTDIIYQDVKDEVIAVREWISQTGLGTFSVVKLTDDGATSIGDIQEAAVQEILGGIEEINHSLADYEQKQGMNAGSMAYSTKTQLARLDKLREKAVALEEALGDILLNVQVHLDVTTKKARKLHKEAAHEVEAAKTQKAAQKKSGKTGTAQDRAKKVAV